MLDIIEKNYDDRITKLGLSSKQAKDRLDEFGYNKLAEKKKSQASTLFLNQFKNTLTIILLISTVISVFLGEIYDAITIIIIVLINSILGFIQEFKTEKTLETLEKMTSPMAKVYRDDELIEIESEKIVPGDIFEIEAGDKVPCDALILSSQSLFADESILTGEAIPVEKIHAATCDENITLNLEHIAYMGTIITKGTAQCRAISTGMKTQMGKVSNMLESIKQEQTPLQKRLGELGRIIAIICMVICFIVFIAGVLRGEPIFDMLMTGITIAIAAIPEGLPAAVTIALALAVNKMLKKNALVHKLHSVETLGCASVICSDKTGTITENKMSVTKISTLNHDYEVTGTGHKISGDILFNNNRVDTELDINLKQILTCSVLCNNASISKYQTMGKRDISTSFKRRNWVAIGDPTETALLIAAAKSNITKDNLSTILKRTHEIPFDSETKCMKVIVKDNDNRKMCFAKGAVDIIIKQCEYIQTSKGIVKLTDNIAEKIIEKNEDLASNALRVIGFAGKELVDENDDINNSLIFFGMMGMIDPPRIEAKKAIKACDKANIKTVMITGDHKITACAIAKQAGILKKDCIALTGEEISKMDDEELKECIDNVSVFARVNPSDKLKIVKAFKAKGHIVAMTGDGVNDAPAIKEANIGVSMGITGTDVTKQAADVILLDDNFATLVSAVVQGRTIYQNIRKFVRYLLSCNIGEVLTMFLGIIMGMPMVLLPTQILLVNLATDGLPAIALGLEPPEDDILNTSPRKATDSFFNGGLMNKIVFRGILIGLATLATFTTLMRTGANIEVCRTGALFTLIVSQLVHCFECKSETKGLFSINIFNNTFMFISVVISALILLATIYLPCLQIVFSTVALNRQQVLISTGYALIIAIISSILKFRK